MSIERMSVEGRTGVVAFMDADFNPVDKRDPNMRRMKIMFDDGENMWLEVEGPVTITDDT